MTRPIERLLIANRGEIAVRIARAAQTLGITSVQAYSEADADSAAVRAADESVLIGPPQAAKSYLNVDALLEAAKSTSVDAVHPGYGFLAENADFADAVVNAGLVFVGPSGDVIRRMGDKAQARRTAKAAGVPTVPGSEGELDVEAAAALAGDIGYPVMVKASAGGGGRGIRVAQNADELRQLFPQAASEAKSAFGHGGLYVEKVVERARHIEVQLLGDGTRAIHCFERECSLQRRRQKVWEEAPSTALDNAARSAVCEAAVRLAEAVGYRGAGTVEFLYDDASGEFYFLEMNTRIQVEHPVTEMITGIDLVAEMIEVAAGKPLAHRQDEVRRSGHAIEVRINAEDPYQGFMPQPGTVTALSVPDADGVRFDHCLYAGLQIPPFYDSLLGKLIVHADTREQAIDKLLTAIDGLNIEGIATTAPLYAELACDGEVAANRVHTRWLEGWLTQREAAAAAGET